MRNWVDLTIDKLVPANWNYKTDNDFISEKLANNIKRNGVVENLLVRKLDTGFYEVVNGNHRLEVLKKLEWSKPVKCYNFGNISLNEAKRIAIETNETHFNVDQEKLSQTINELIAEFNRDELLETMPYDDFTFDNIINNDVKLEPFVFTDTSNRESSNSKILLTVIFESEDDQNELFIELRDRGYKVKI